MDKIKRKQLLVVLNQLQIDIESGEYKPVLKLIQRLQDDNPEIIEDYLRVEREIIALD